MMTPDDGGDWGIYGGRFDPVHYGHLNIASEIRMKKKLAGILFIPSFSHPLKKEKTVATFERRCRMLEIAFEEYENFYLSKIELDYELSGFTLDTILKLKDTYPKCNFSFIIGADNLNQFQQWYKPKEILEEVRLLLAARPGYELTKIEDFPAEKIEIIETNLYDVSSTELRQMLKGDLDSAGIELLLPEKVLNYINENNLY